MTAFFTILQKYLCFCHFGAKRLKTGMVMLDFSKILLKVIWIYLTCKINGSHPADFSLLHLWKGATNYLLFFIGCLV